MKFAVSPFLASLAAMTALAGGLLLSRPAQAGNEVTLNGTGATFPAKVYAQWAESYAKERGIVVHYEGTGSSMGQKQIKARAVDFGATDVPMSSAELEKNGLFQFPTLVGGVVPVVHLPGVAAGRLHLNAEVLAGIFTGHIQRWNDPAIAALNPGLALPEQHITRVVRADGSGTTEVFVSYLKQVAPGQAADIVGQGTTVQWPGSVNAVEGSGKVAAAVKATPGAIGYISSDYVLRENLTPASLRNKRGDWVNPSIESYRAAVRAGGLFRDSLEAAPLLDVDGPGVWPIVTATYIVVDRSPASLERAGRTLNFFYRSFLMGDRAVAGSGFAPLPTETQARIVAKLSSFRTQDGRVLPVMGGLDGPATTIAAQH
ncbi:MAG TPA: phosphate ABC transporter substrate-binding protein PstS [Methylibium sp.]